MMPRGPGRLTLAVAPLATEEWIARKLMSAFLGLLSIVLAGPLAAQDARPIVFQNVAVVDVAGGSVAERQRVVIQGGRIAAVGAADALAVPAGAVVVEGAGRYLLPGLWDMHVHALFDPRQARPLLALLLAHGVTGIRDMGGLLSVVLDVRKRARDGEILSPRLFVAGPILDGPEALHPEVSWVLDTPEEGRAAVDSLARAGVDFVKVYSMLPREVFYAIAAAARDRGLPMAGHVPISITPQEASEAGMASIEHLRSEVEPFCPGDAPSDCEELFTAFREHGTWHVPTLVVRRNRAFLDDSAAVSGSWIGHAPRPLREEWEGTRAARLERGPDYFAGARERYLQEQGLTGALNRAAIPILAGSDAGDLFSLHGYSLHEELALLVEAGLSPSQALRAATTDAARFLGMEEVLGSIAPGMMADLVLLDANPLEDIRNTRLINAVVFDGRLLDRAALDEMLAEVERDVRE